MDRANPGRVKVVAEVDSSAPVSGATEARLGLLGLTGLLYIDLQKNPAGSPARVLDRGDDYPVIPSRQGDIEAFIAKMPVLINHAADILGRVQTVLSDDNLASIAESLKNIRVASRDLPAVAHEAAALASDLRSTSTEVRELAANLRGVSSTAGPQLEATLAGMKTAVEELGRTADSLERIVAGNEATLTRFAGSGVADLQQLVGDLRVASDEVRALARSLREEPSSLLIEKKESGMEIPR